MNTDILIVGGDGDLALRKLYPSLYYLELNECMPPNTRIIGTARTEQTQEQFLTKVHQWLKENILLTSSMKLHNILVVYKVSI